jgi:hypothetical protein
VYFGLLRAKHRKEKHSVAEWKGLIESYRTRPIVQER